MGSEMCIRDSLGRPGYMASTEGVWPYTYDSCDAGITANQSSPDGISYLSLIHI